MMQADRDIGGFLSQVGGLLGDEQIPVFEDPPRPSLSLNPSDEESADSSCSENEFYSSVEVVLETLKVTKEDNHVKNQEVILCLSDRMPLHSIDAMALLLKRIHQIIVARTKTLSHNCDFIRALETVLEGLVIMKKGAHPVPRELTRIFEQSSPSSLLVALEAFLIEGEELEVTSESESEEKVIDILDFKLQNAHIEKPHCAASECESTVALTDDMSVYSPRSSTIITSTTEDYISAFKRVDIQSLVEENKASDTDGYKTPDLEYGADAINCAETNTISASSSDFSAHNGKDNLDIFRKDTFVREELFIPDLAVGNVLTEETSSSERSLEKPSSHEVSPHFDEALQSIEIITTNLQSEEAQRNCANVNSESMTTGVSRIKPAKKVAVVEKSSLSKAPPGRRNSLLSDCESTVGSSLDSIDITDDGESERSAETEGTGLFNCAFDSMLDIVLGPCYLPDDSDLSVSSIESGQSFQDDDSFFECKPSTGEIETERNRNIKDRVPRAKVHVSSARAPKAQHSKTALMESDYEDTESDSNQSEWWIRDTRGVETASFTSF